MKQTCDDSSVLVVWEGEWAPVKAVVAQARHHYQQVTERVRDVLDVPMYVALARRYTDTTDRYVSSLAMDAHSRLQQHNWVARAAGVLLSTSYVMTKSAFLGPLTTARNGIICATLFTCILFPEELFQSFNRSVWFNTIKAGPQEKN